MIPALRVVFLTALLVLSPVLAAGTGVATTASGVEVRALSPSGVITPGETVEVRYEVTVVGETNASVVVRPTGLPDGVSAVGLAVRTAPGSTSDWESLGTDAYVGTSLVGGETVTVTVTYRIGRDVPTGEYPLTLAAETATNERANDTATLVVAETPLTVSVDGPTDPVAPGSTVRVTYDVENRGVRTVDRADLRATVPDGWRLDRVEVRSVPPDTTVERNDTGVVLGRFPAGGRVALVVEYRVDPNASVGTVSLPFTAVESRQGTTVNASTTTAVRVTSTPLGLSATGPNGPVAPGESFSVTYEVQNLGGATTDNVTFGITDRPTGLEVVAVSTTGGRPAGDDAVFDRLGPGATATVTVTFRVATDAPETTARMTARLSDPDPDTGATVSVPVAIAAATPPVDADTETTTDVTTAIDDTTTGNGTDTDTDTPTTSGGIDLGPGLVAVFVLAVVAAGVFYVAVRRG
jgi:hypothetical protein